MLRLLPLLIALATPTHAAEPTTDPAIGRVNMGGVRDRSACTGALVAPGLVLTAAHCLTRPTGAGPLHFVAGWDRGTHAGHHEGALALRAEAPGVAGDVALMAIAPRSDLAPLALAPVTDGPFTVTGYRRSQPHLQDTLTCPLLDQAGAQIKLDCAVEPGLSGAPVRDAAGRVVAVLSAGTTDGHAVAVIPGTALRAAIDAR